VLFDKVKSDRIGSHPDWTDFLQSADWSNDAAKIRESSKDDIQAFSPSAFWIENDAAKTRDASNDESSDFSHQSADWTNSKATKMRESSEDDGSPAETYKMAGVERRVPSKHIISLAEFDDVKKLVATSHRLTDSL
jgi:hypothetical protein